MFLFKFLSRFSIFKVGIGGLQNEELFDSHTSKSSALWAENKDPALVILNLLNALSISLGPLKGLVACKKIIFLLLFLYLKQHVLK